MDFCKNLLGRLLAIFTFGAIIYIYCLIMSIGIARVNGQVTGQVTKPNKPVSAPSARYTYNLATDFVVSDGDTFRCTVDQGFGSIRPRQDVRVNGFDAWETTYIRKAKDIHITPSELELGIAAKAYLRTILEQARAVHVVYDASDLDPYGRGLLWVFVDGKELGDLMRKAGHERFNLLPPPQIKYR